MKESKKYLGWLLILYCLIRIPILLSPLEDISGEVSRAAIAYDLIHGLRLPIWDYPVDPYGLGSLLASLYTVPFFLLFGETWFALKLVPFCLHFFSVMGWYWLWVSYFSPKKAFAITSFLIFSPPLISEYFLSNTGYHFDVVLWMAWNLLLLKKIFVGKISVGVGGWLLGLLGGFSTAMILTNFVTVFLILVYVIGASGNLFDRKRFCLFYGMGFCLAVAPLILLNAAYGWQGALFARDFLTDELSFSFFRTHLSLLFKEALMGLFGYRHFSQNWGRLFAWPFLGFYFFSLGLLALKQFRSCQRFGPGLNIEFFAFLFQIFLVFLVGMTKGVLCHQYLFPMIPFVGMTLVLGAEVFTQRLRLGLAVFYLAGVLGGNLKLISFSEFGKTLSMKIPLRSEGDLIFTLETKFGHNPDLFWRKAKTVLKNESFAVREEFYQSLSRGIFQIKDRGDLKKHLSTIRGTEPEFQSILYDRLGVALGAYCRFDPKILAPLFREYAIPPKGQGPVYAGFIQGLNWVGTTRAQRVQVAQGICETIPAAQQSFCREGLRRLDP